MPAAPVHLTGTRLKEMHTLPSNRAMAMNQAPFAYTTQRLGESPSFLSVSQWEGQILGSRTVHYTECPGGH